MRSHTSAAALAVALLVVLLTVAAPPLTAAPGRWTRTGPEGGNACALVAAPSQPALLYAGFPQGGVFRSADGGHTWTFAGHGLWKANAACTLAVDAKAPGTVWAGTAAGLFKSTDHGASWRRATSQITNASNPSVSVVLAHPRKSGFLWVAVPMSGLFRTLDGGATWQHFGIGLQGDVTTLAVDPVHLTTLYAGTVKGVFKTTDAGLSWRLLPQHLSSSPAVRTIVVDPRDPRRLFLAPTEQLLKSTDGGASWSYSTIGLGNLAVYGIAFDAVKPAVMYAATHSLGVYKSTDSGRTWKPTGPGIPGSAINAVIANPAGLFAASTGGVAASTNQGASWQIGRGLSATIVSGLTVTPENPPRLYASQADLIWKSADRGGFWLPIPPSIPIPVTTPVAVDPTASEKLYAGIQSAFTASTDGGRHWSVLPGFTCMIQSRILVDPVTPSTLYTSGPLDFQACIHFIDRCATLKSTDSGSTWSCIKNGLPGPAGTPVLALDPFAPSHLYASDPALAGHFSGLYRSLDGGATWDVFAPQIAAYDLVFDQTTPGLVYAALRSGVGRSTDAGVTWQFHAEGLRNEIVRHLALDPQNPNILYAATLNQVFRSTDAGSTWQLAGPGLEEVQVLDVDVDPVDPKIIYAATSGGGVMKLEQE
jgi:photosystem II stability/assembly factor-like uncharacterized protein